MESQGGFGIRIFLIAYFYPCKIKYSRVLDEKLTPKPKNHQPVEMQGKPTNVKQQPSFGVNQANQKI